MLTTAQTTLTAATDPNGEWYCTDCAMKEAEEESGVPCKDLGVLRMWLAKMCDDGWSAFIEYEVSEYEDEGNGIYCDQCGDEIKKPRCGECGGVLTEEDIEADNHNTWYHCICLECAKPEEDEDAEE